MAFGTSRYQRQSDLRKRLGDDRTGPLQRLREFLCWPVVIGFAFWGAAATLVLSGRSRMPYALGQVVQQPVFSRVNFEIVDEARTAELRTRAQQEVPNYFRLNRSLVDAILSDIRDLHAAVKSADSFEKYHAAQPTRDGLDARGFAAIKSLTDADGSARFKRDLDELSSRIIQEEMIEKDHVEREDVRSTAAEVQLDRGDGKFSPWPKEKLTYAVNSEHVEALAETLVKDLFLPEVRPVLRNLITQAVLPPGQPSRPVYLFDKEQTKARIVQAASVPPAYQAYRIGDRLVKPGVLTGDTLVLLKAEHEEYLKQRTSNPDLRGALIKERIGVLGLVMLLTIGWAIYSYRCHARAVTRTPRAVALAVMVLSMLLVDRYLPATFGSSPYWSVGTIVIAAAILTVSYSQLFAIGGGVALSLLAVLTYNTGLELLLTQLTAAAVTILLLKDIRTRLRMVQVGIITALAAAASTTLVGLVAQDALRLIATEAAFSALSAMIGVSFVLVLLPVIERAFRITTSLTLLEWADTSKLLLRQLIESAPGTWQHSHLLGSMAETAAEEIGANGLLVRVGAYYHDIGKMCKPNYFVENQAGNINAHRKLAPTMSLLVILAHVKDGLSLAREHGLPLALHPFIAEHHGTTVVRYFHSMAAQEVRAAGRDQREVTEAGFRYPGPKPRSVESAILMLCDGVEGAVRSVAEPTPGRIEGLVHEIVMARLMDGQFDDCDITLKELSRVEQCLVRSLCSIYHGRVAYPAAPASESPRDDASKKMLDKIGA